MKDLATSERCNGCHACYNICPVNAIEMYADRNGFLHPKILPEKCIECGLCGKACPVVNAPEKNTLAETYACYAKDSEEHRTSSSGGAFAVLARKVLAGGGIVCGAAFDHSQQVRHIMIRNEDELHLLKGPKYVQSTIGNSYRVVKEELLGGKLVLFSGTPCQIAGLKSYLGGDHNNLLTIDIVCHGVPSPAVWEQHLREISGGEALVAVTFRNKNAGIHEVTLDYQTTDGRLIQEKYTDSMYIKAFQQNLSLRSSCFSCPFKGEKRCSDFTAGDFWSAKEYHKELVNSFGVSALIVHSEKGKRWLDECREGFIIVESSPAKASVWNEPMMKPAVPNPNRERFFRSLANATVAEATNANMVEPPANLPPKAFHSLIAKLKGKMRKWLA